MADKDNNGQKKASTGRGSLLLQMMKKQQAEQSGARAADLSAILSPSYRQETVSTTQKTDPMLSLASAYSSIPPGQGRGSLLKSLQAVKELSKSSPQESPALGRGKPFLTSLVKKTTTPAQPLMEERESSIRPPLLTREQLSTTRQPLVAEQQRMSPKDDSGVLGSLSKLSVYETSHSTTASSYQESQVISRQGTTGREVDILANYIDLKLEPGKGLFQYEIKFNPDIDSIGLRRKLLNQHSAALGRTKSFDGALLYLPQRLPEEKTTFKSDHPLDGSPVILTLIFKKQQKMSENVQFFNVLFGRIMRALNLVRIGKQNFNPTCAHAVPQHRLEVWPGYVTAINEHEGGLKLCIDAKHRVMRMETVRDLMVEIHARKQQDYKDCITMEVVGASVLTRYNNKTYRIDDIAWDKNPLFEFERQGTPTSIIDYYKNHWNLQIKDKEQPLLVHRAKEKTTTGETIEKLTLLVPELCYIAGLTDNIRSDFRIMKDLDAITKVSPNGRRDVIKKFVQEVQKNDITRELLSEWGLQLNNGLTQLKGRVLPPECIFFGNGKKIDGKPNADWGAETSNSCVLRAPRLTRWFIFYSQRDTRYTSGFIKMLLGITQNLGLQFSAPQEIALRDDRTDTYLRELRNNIDNGTEMVVIIFPSNRTDRYSAIKKLCCVDKPIPSQVIVSRTLSRADKLKAITQKIALQMNCKLGGALWAVNIPFDKCMVCGIDVYHPGVGQGRRGSVAGFVASMDKFLTSWYSKICLQGTRQELVDLLQICFIASINAYKKQNGSNPDRIIVYRDGVSDGEIDTVGKYEVKQLLTTFARIDPNYKPQLSVIIVQKRVNTRLFLRRWSAIVERYSGDIHLDLIVKCKDPKGYLDISNSFENNHLLHFLFYREHKELPAAQRDLVNPEPGTVIDSCITRANFYDFFLVPQNIRQGTVTPTHYIVAYDGSNMKPDHMQRFTYKLCHLYYNWPGTIRVPAPCQYAHKLVSLVGQNIQMEPNPSLCNYLFYL